MDQNKYAQAILQLLKQKYPVVKSALNYSNALELLVATILSAQCRDTRVNIVTEKLFKDYKTPNDYVVADIEKLKAIIRPTGFYNNKAKNIQSMAKLLLNNYNGQVPDSLEELIKLPGVARKTANVVLSNWFKINTGIAVDTHVKRVSNRLGLTTSDDPKQIEKDLVQKYPKAEWGDLSLRIIEHGRQTCKSRKPDCANCILNHICPSAFSAGQKDSKTVRQKESKTVRQKESKKVRQ